MLILNASAIRRQRPAGVQGAIGAGGVMARNK
jgi:hypothetical protein